MAKHAKHRAEWCVNHNKSLRYTAQKRGQGTSSTRTHFCDEYPGQTARIRNKVEEIERMLQDSTV